MENNKATNKSESILAYGAGFGVVFGITLGAIFENLGIALGISIGIITGVVITLLFGKKIVQLFDDSVENNLNEKK